MKLHKLSLDQCQSSSGSICMMGTRKRQGQHCTLQNLDSHRAEGTREITVQTPQSLNNENNVEGVGETELRSNRPCTQECRDSSVPMNALSICHPFHISSKNNTPPFSLSALTFYQSFPLTCKHALISLLLVPYQSQTKPESNLLQECTGDSFSAFLSLYQQTS